MPYVNVKLDNGRDWGITHCELILPVNSLEGMNAEDIGGKVLALAAYADEFQEYLQDGKGQNYFDSFAAFLEVLAIWKRTEEERRQRKVLSKRIRSEIRGDYERTFVRIGRRDGFNCRVCGSAAGDLQIDHIRPVSKDGDNDLSNLQLLCSSCNNKKSNIVVIEGA